MALRREPHVLVVAGSDSSGGAGIARDIETISSIGVRTFLAVTALTVQTHEDVKKIHQSSPSLVADQMRAALRANNVAAIKIGIRSHWAIENSLHWVLDVTFQEDKCRSRTGHGPANMAVVRHFAFNLLRSLDDKRSIKLRRKRAARDNQYLEQILQPSIR